MEWEDVLNMKGFLLNMDRGSDRLKICTNRLFEAGFTNVERYRGIDRDTDDLEKEWEKFGSPKFMAWDTAFQTNKGKQACALGHYNIWKHIISNNIEYAIIFEDDIIFHKYWSILGPEYWKITPKDFDVVFIGNQIDNNKKGLVESYPTLCLHAYMVSLEGAKKLYNVCLCSEAGTCTIDCILYEHMVNNSKNFKWYVWNAIAFYDSNAYIDSKLSVKNTGLIFQDSKLGSYIVK